MATAAWPNEIPPSFGGRARGTRTSRPRSAHAAVVHSSSSRFWKTPPLSATRSSPARSAAPRTPRRSPARALGACARRPATRDAGVHVAEDRADRGARVDHEVAADRQLVRAALDDVGERLELDRRLALVGAGRADPAERGDGIEQSPGARRPRRRETAARRISQTVSHCSCPTARRSDSGGRSRAAPAACSQAAAIRQGAGARPGPARSRTGRMIPACSALRRSPTRISPPQTVPSQAVARAVVDRPDGRPAAAMFGQARGEVRVTTLDADRGEHDHAVDDPLPARALVAPIR